MAPDAPPPLDAAVLARYVAGECSAEEAAAVRRALAASPDAAAALARALERLDGGPAPPSARDAAASWATLRARMHAPAQARHRPRHRTR